MKKINPYYESFIKEKKARQELEKKLLQAQDSYKELETEKKFLTRELENNICILEEKEREVRTILEVAADGILTVNINGDVISCNKAGESILEYEKGELLGKHISELFNVLPDFHAKKGKRKEMNIFNVIKKNDGSPLEVSGICKDSYHIPLELSSSKIELYGCPAHVCIIRDISDRKLTENKLVYQATHDPLSGLPNRSLLLDRMEEAFHLAKRYNKKVGIIYFDLDHFKSVNDTLGHRFGDLLLKEVVFRVNKTLRKSDTFSRHGGDEFIIILPFIEKEGSCLGAVQRLNKVLKKPFIIDGHEISVTASTGISIYPDHGDNAMELLKNADIAMYYAKGMGRNTVQLFVPEINTRIIDRFNLEDQLRRAVVNNDFHLHYQPIVSLKTGQIVALEALIRWKHPKFGLVPPLNFIPLAEETGLILPIGEWVLETACAQNKKWQKMGLPPLQIAVNVSAHQLKQNNIFQAVKRVLKKTKLDPSYLELELTESAVIEHIAEVLPALIKSSEMGIKIAIDDFGTGYSSLSYLKKLPASILKIDQSFISQLASNADDIAIVLSILSMAHKLGLKVIAEGVTTEEQLQFLAENHCDMIQGYYFSRPLSTKGITKLLKKNYSLDPEFLIGANPTKNAG